MFALSHGQAGERCEVVQGEASMSSANYPHICCVSEETIDEVDIKPLQEIRSNTSADAQRRPNFTLNDANNDRKGLLCRFDDTAESAGGGVIGPRGVIRAPEDSEDSEDESATGT